MLDGKGDSKRKWSPEEDAESGKFYAECKTVYLSSRALISVLKDILAKHNDGLEVDQDFDSVIQSMITVLESLRRVNLSAGKAASEELDSYKRSLWKGRLWVERLAISKLTYDIVTHFLDSPLVESILRLAHLYNESLLLTLSSDSRNINVFSNKCPMLLYPLRKLSITKLLQILAKKRAECCSFMFVDALLSNYMYPDKIQNDKDALLSDVKTEETAQKSKHEAELIKEDEISQLLIAQDSISSDTSIEIYRALTKHLTQTVEGKEICSKPLDLLLSTEDKRMRKLLAVCAKAAPQLIGSNCIKPSKTSGDPKVKKAVKEKLTKFYQEVLWGEVGGYVEHGLLWWTADPLGSYPPNHSHQLRDYIIKLKDTDLVPPLLIPAMNSLIDALCCHITSTSWDQLFRKTLVSAENPKSQAYRGFGNEGTATGRLFEEMLADLVQLTNSCEDLHLHLEELPLVEQIPVLHRLDHSVHTARLWTASQCRHLAANWNLDEFHCTCHTDITKCLETLNKLQLADHGVIPATTSVQVTVCAQMRAKLTSEVRENIEKLKKTPIECINVLGRACRTQCLANLHMSFPPPLYWRQSGPLPDYASEYVENYLDCILRPVFTATNKMALTVQQSSSSMILRILCESWLEYIYSHRVKFSEWGAVQLLTDFGAVPTWLMERVQLRKELLHPLVTHEVGCLGNESNFLIFLRKVHFMSSTVTFLFIPYPPLQVLRRCEGVGRLLLRRRGESIAMSAPLSSKTNEESSADNMPAEMYVPNQEQWLELRAPLQANICCQL